MISNTGQGYAGARRWCAHAALCYFVVIAGCTSAPKVYDVGRKEVYAAQFDLLWSRYDQVYPSFNLKKIDWNASRATFRPKAIAARSQDEFIAIVREMLDPLHDLHSWFVDPRGQTVPTYRPSSISNFDEDRWQKAMSTTDYTARGNGWGEASLAGYGYLLISTWNLQTADVNALDKALTRMRDMPGIIIDVRSNAGGSDAPAYSFVSRFTTRPFIASYWQVRTGNSHSDLSEPQARIISPRGAWQYTKPVVVIAGRGAFSANESFVAAMRALPQVTIVGDTTGGASGNPATFSLGNGWQFTVPQWIELTPDHQPIEGHGVAPHMVVKWYPEWSDLDRDPLIDSALGWLAEKTGAFRATPSNKP